MSKIMNDIDSPLKYSKLACSLDRIFKGVSVDSLKNRKMTINFRHENKQDCGKINYYNDPGKLELFDNINSTLPNIKTNVKDNVEVKKSRNLEEINNTKSNSLYSLRKRISTNTYYQTPDPGKYNPNFNSIYKKQPCFIIRKEQNFSLKIQDSNDKSKDDKSSDLKTTIKSFLDTNQKLLSSTVADKKTLKSSIILEKTIPQHTKFRNISMFVKNDNNPNVFSYIEPHEYQTLNKKIIKSVDFKKMNERDDLLITKDPIPGVCTYDPKYETIESKSLKNIKNLKEKVYEKKKLIINKLWRSYKVGIDYKTVQLETFLKNKDLNN